MHKNVTMSDVAKEMGVSTVTVSKAITGKEGVSEELREKIKQCAKGMGYVYSLGGASDKEKKNYTIGVLVAEHFVSDEAYDEDTFYSKIYQRIVLELSEKNNYGIMEIVTAEAEKRAWIPNIVSNEKVDGILVLGQMEQPYMKMLGKCGVPFLLMDCYDEDLNADSVISNNIHGAYMLTKYLIDNGHTKIGYVGNANKTSSILDRYLGYYKALFKAGIDLNTKWVINDRDDEWKYIDIELPADMPTAFVCNNDEVAFRLIKKLNEEGYKVPDDISVVGYDNFIHAHLCSPKLTTFGIDTDHMVDVAVDTILNKVANGDSPIGSIVVNGDIVIGDSVKKIN